MRKWMVAIAFVLLGASAAWAQEKSYSERVSEAQPSQYRQPECKLKHGHFLVGSGATYLKSGMETSIPGNRARLFDDAKRVLFEAINEKNQAENGAAWYYLGRTYLMEGDVIGADSAFRKAEKLEPDCADDIALYRRASWVVLVQPATEFLQADQPDSAFPLLTLANTIYRGEPNAMYMLGILHANANRNDSAIVYFRGAADISARIAETNPAVAEDRNKSVFNLAVMLGNAGRYQEAVTEWRRYVSWVPDDMDAKRGLAQAFRGAGMVDSAQAIESQLVATAGEDAGAGREDLFRIGVNAFNEKNYEAAVKAFSALVEREPNHRDAIFNLANSYFVTKNGTALITTAERLLTLDPMSEYGRKLLGEGYRLTDQSDKLLAIFEKIEAAPFNFEVKDFRVRADGATFKGEAVGRAARDIQGNAVTKKPMTLSFEFLAEGGTVVDRKDVTIPVLEPEAVEEVTVEGTGEGIVAWRYTAKEM